MEEKKMQMEIELKREEMKMKIELEREIAKEKLQLRREEIANEIALRRQQISAGGGEVSTNLPNALVIYDSFDGNFNIVKKEDNDTSTIKEDLGFMPSPKESRNNFLMILVSICRQVQRQTLP